LAEFKTSSSVYQLKCAHLENTKLNLQKLLDMCTVGCWNNPGK